MDVEASFSTGKLAGFGMAWAPDIEGLVFCGKNYYGMGARYWEGVGQVSK